MPIIIKRKVKAPAPEPVVEPVAYRAEGSLRLDYPHGVVLPSGEHQLMDGMYEASRKGHPAASVSWFLMASYAYYILDTPIVSDGCFDEMAKDILANWPLVQRHEHAKYLTKEDLEAGTLYRLKWDNYPMLAVAALTHLLVQTWGATLTR